jgi:hypothetical protein
MSHVRSVSSLFAVLHTAAFSYGPLTHSGQLEQQREQTVSEPTGLDAEREQGPGTVSRSKRETDLDGRGCRGGDQHVDQPVSLARDPE